MRKPISILPILLALSVVAVASENRRDGNWWLTQTKPSKLDYVTGFFDGMALGHEFSYWGILNKTQLTKGDNECLEEVGKSKDGYEDKFFSNVTNGQLVDGLDAFYSDYRNRRIRLHDAIWLVVNEIAGTPQDKLDKMIEGWRGRPD